MCICSVVFLVFFFKQKTAYEMRISDWSSDVCSSDVDRTQLAGLDQRGDRRPVLGAELVTCEQGILALERDRPHRPLNRVVVDVDPAIVEEPDEPGPVGQRIVDRLEGRRAAEHAPALGVGPAMPLVAARTGTR